MCHKRNYRTCSIISRILSESPVRRPVVCGRSPHLCILSHTPCVLPHTSPPHTGTLFQLCRYRSVFAHQHLATRNRMPLVAMAFPLEKAHRPLKIKNHRDIIPPTHPSSDSPSKSWLTGRITSFCEENALRGDGDTMEAGK